ncbi:MAG: aminotransferase class V-fold PLP-dependent enzyme [Acidobacteria bacterium]|nr:aminotransferase class V-fold PLP-dependent enzyme [Acidobacteriota bacterium]
MSTPDSWVPKSLRQLNRRQLFGWAGLAGGMGWFAGRNPAAAATMPGAMDQAAQKIGGSTIAAAPNVYEAIGVRPFVNCRGTLTVLGGNIELPEVQAAKTRANLQHAQLDEVMHAVGQRLAELTGAEWGMVSAGCAAAMSHATAACVAGGNPDRHVRIPNLEGFAKDEVIIPGSSRNVYDAAIRAVGVRIVEVDTPDELERAIGPRTAMIYIFAKPENESGPMGTEAIAAVAKRHDVPVLVDAAAEVLTIPNLHLQRGATLVAYSGGKFIRGPQSAGLLLGRKDLVQAAWVHSAPHHGYARAMKVGREEMIGMLVAVESWAARDHEAQWRDWIARCRFIADRVSTIAGVTTNLRTEPGGRSNRSPQLTVRWEAQKLGLTGADVVQLLDSTDPRILLSASGGNGGRGGGPPLAGDTGIALVPSTMAPGDEKIVADRLAAVLSAAHTLKPPAPVLPPAGDLTGVWDVQIKYVASASTHTISVFQNNGRLTGVHQGDFQSRDLTGTVSGDAVAFGSTVTERHGDSLSYRFTGTLAGDAMSGALDMGEYLKATWTAKRRASGSARSAG